MQLYRQQTLEPTPAPQAANEPIARNIKTQRASKAALAEGAEIAPELTTESGAKTPSAGGLEHLAEAITAQTIEFVAPPASAALTGPAPTVRLVHE